MSNSREEGARLDPDEFHRLVSQRQLYERNLEDARALMVEYQRKILECRRITEEQGDLIREIQFTKDIGLEDKRNIFKQLDMYKMLSMCHICSTQPRDVTNLPYSHYSCCEECMELLKLWRGVQACLMCDDGDQGPDNDSVYSNGSLSPSSDWLLM
ncbi:hypothetical protein R1sor_006426 [Riccia sorocarpa]|uniref:Uncharacterized protein n=1 Tax=Riccia sorocarpa TaxID=122646 RepID=A0ABD3HMG5_9MARC